MILALGPVLHIGGHRPAARRRRDPAALRLAGARGAVHGHQPLGEPLRRDGDAGAGGAGGAGLNGLADGCRGGAEVVAVAAIALIVFEFLPAPYPLSEPDTPAWYDAGRRSAARRGAQSADEL